jgi:glycosyltransferase involved in cell wall biosynthesis
MAIDPDAFVYLFFGKIKPYKQIGTLIAAFEKVAGDSLLLIAGACEDERERDRLLNRSRGNDRMRLALEFIPDDQVPTLFGAADVVVAPFSQILTSGSVVLGLSFGCPIIAPALGCLPELISAEVGMCYDPTDQEALPRAMQEARTWDLATMGDRARLLAVDLDWQAIAKKTLDLYRFG